MICPEGSLFQNELNESMDKVNENMPQIVKKGASEKSSKDSSSRNLKTWKKTIASFFRHQLRSTRSNDGDHSTGNNTNFEDKDLITPEQKWQSLGKMFRRQNFGDHFNKSFNEGESSSSSSKPLAVRKVVSSYFSKLHKSPADIKQ